MIWRTTGFEIRDREPAHQLWDEVSNLRGGTGDEMTYDRLLQEHHGG
jgi:hypothetical protein